VHLGTWLTAEQGHAPWQTPDNKGMKGQRDRALLGLLSIYGLRRHAAVSLRLDHSQQREITEPLAMFSPAVAPSNSTRALRRSAFRMRVAEILDKGVRLIYFALQSEFPMNDLHKALGDIGNIRRQMARSTEFRGYGPATLAATGIIAILAAGAQAFWLPDPIKNVPVYLAIWISTAILSAALIGAEMYARTRRIHSGMADEMIRMAVEQFLPSAGAGALITLVLVRYAPAALWMLPGLWQVIFSLGVFSSCRFLPRPMVAAGVWYLLTGLVCIALADTHSFSPWTMGISYGAGQLLVASILQFTRPETENER
jgi:hypothetical protein